MSGSEHPDIVDLEAARTGESDSGVVSHLESCPTCQARLAFLQALQDELPQLDTVTIPQDRDQAVLALARERARIAAGARRPIRRIHWLVPVAAAAVLLLVLLGPWSTPEPSNPADVNRDGTVDIVDAMMLARQVEARQDLPPEWDLNGDQSVDHRDADSIARAVVALGRTSP